jgi:hypothetical protein
MHRISALFFVFTFVMFSLADSASAQTYSYPELNVVPRASDRLLMESKWERKHRGKIHLGVQASAATTLIAGLMAEVDTDKDEDEISSAFATGVGLGWLAITYGMSRKYLPYTKGYIETKKIKGNSKRDQLTRERLAEETIHEAASLGRKMKWISFITNFAANMYLASKSEKESTGSYVANIGALLSFAPFLFNYHWEGVEKSQDSYKKKIYAPVASTGILYNPIERKTVPGLTLALQF